MDRDRSADAGGAMKAKTSKRPEIMLKNAVRQWREIIFLFMAFSF